MRKIIRNQLCQLNNKNNTKIVINFTNFARKVELNKEIAKEISSANWQQNNKKIPQI